MGAFAILAAPASARNAYVTNSGSGSVSVIDSQTNAVVATVPVGAGPSDVAITPDGRFAYVANATAGTVSVIATGSNAVVGAPTTVGANPRGIAITPDGRLAYVTNFDDGTVSVIATATRTTIGPPIVVGSKPDGIAITPDGLRAFVAQQGGDISIVNTSTNTVVDVVPDASAPSRVSIGPRGLRAFVTNNSSNTVTVFNPTNGTVIGGPIAVGAQPAGIAIGPDGLVAYAASPVDGTLTAINAAQGAAVATIGGFPGATGVAIRPDGAQGYVTNGTGATTSVLSTAQSASVGSIPVGAAPTGVAIVPNQAPRASFLVTPQRRLAKRKLTFQAGASKDPDGKIATYAWDFGDGKRVKGPQTRQTHTYRRPGTYVATLTVTDDEGCSTESVFTGQTASCNGSALASVASTIVVIDPTPPALRLAGGRRQRLGGRVNVFAQCPLEPCAVRARGRISMTLERRGRDLRRTFRIGPATMSLGPGGWGRLGVRLPRRIRRPVARAIRRGGRAEAMLTVIARDSVGNQTLRERTVKLVLPRAKRGNR